jgi:hypothetical protein
MAERTGCPFLLSLWSYVTGYLATLQYEEGSGTERDKGEELEKGAEL